MPFLSSVEDAEHPPTRRGFLKAAGLAVLSLALPKFLGARTNATSFWFLQTETGDSWPVVDPVSWSLDNAQLPVLARAREGLLKLTPADGVRIIRLVARRCKLNLIEIQAKKVVVHYWGHRTWDAGYGSMGWRHPNGHIDLRPFLKQQGLARKCIKVTLIDRKRETSTVRSGDDFLYGERLGQQIPVGLYMRKWRRRSIEEPDDWQAAPCSWSNFCWEGVKQRYIPWRVMKSAWQKENAPLCQNCDLPTVLVNFGLPWCGMCNREARFVRVCQKCRRIFSDHSIDRFDVGKWMVSNLDAEVWPDFDTVWNRPSRKWKPPSR